MKSDDKGRAVMEVGDLVRMRWLPLRAVGEFRSGRTVAYTNVHGVRFVVTEKNRPFGLTIVTSESGSEFKFLEDRDDPEVVYLGTGDLKCEYWIEMDEVRVEREIKVSKSEGG